MRWTLLLLFSTACFSQDVYAVFANVPGNSPSSLLVWVRSTQPKPVTEVAIDLPPGTSGLVRTVRFQVLDECAGGKLYESAGAPVRSCLPMPSSIQGGFPDWWAFWIVLTDAERLSLQSAGKVGLKITVQPTETFTAPVQVAFPS